MTDLIKEAEQKQKLLATLADLKQQGSSIVVALQKAQEIYKYLPREVMETIADVLEIKVSEVYGVATFYSQFSLKPVGDYKIAVCMGTACYVKGAGEILSKIKSLLKIDIGQTSPDGRFSLEASRCIGCCGLAPVLTVNEHVYGKVGLKEVEEIVQKYNPQKNG